jgi:hypothetical protein
MTMSQGVAGGGQVKLNAAINHQLCHSERSASKTFSLSKICSAQSGNPGMLSRAMKFQGVLTSHRPWKSISALQLFGVVGRTP